MSSSSQGYRSLRRIQAEARNSLVIVTHDMGIHANLADRIAIMYAGQIIEEAPAKQIFGNPQHPYTKYLIHSLPRIGINPIASVHLGGLSLMVPPKGCRFRDRCEQKRRICREERPLLVSIGENHKVACFLAVKEGAHAITTSRFCRQEIFPRYLSQGWGLPKAD